MWFDFFARIIAGPFLLYNICSHVSQHHDSKQMSVQVFYSCHVVMKSIISKEINLHD